MRDRFLFRDELGINEKENRVNSDYFDWNVPLVRNTATEAGLSEDDIENKDETIRLFKSELADDQYEEFIDELFQKYGKRGNQFNFQLYSMEDGFSVDSLMEAVEQYRGASLNDEVEMEFPRNIRLLDSNLSSDADTGDLLFFVQGTPESDLAEEFELVEDGEAKKLVDSTEISDEALLRRSTDYHMELKIYPKRDMIAISNSNGPDELQNKVIDLVKDWGFEDE